MARHLRKGNIGQVMEEPSVNLTPLIDVVFVILIMFILIAPLFEIENIELANASAVDKEAGALNKDAGPIAIQVFRDDTIQFNKVPVGIDRLYDLLLLAKRQYPSAAPQLFHDRRASFGVYQSIKNALEAAGFEEVDLVLQPAN